jgi:signal peptidase
MDSRDDPSTRADGRAGDEPETDGFEAFLDAAREFLSGAAIVVLVGLVLFAVSGVWPPMVAVESGSMEPNMETGDLVFVMAEGRLVPEDARAGVVTREVGRDTGYRTFDGYGDVIVFQPGGREGTPTIHRAQFWVEEGENWYEKADERYVFGDSCEVIAACPAPHDGFITKGDANPTYDQMGHTGPVKPAWVVGKAKLRVPYLGWVRLAFAGKV